MPEDYVDLSATTEEDLRNGIIRGNFRLPLEFFVGHQAGELRARGIFVPPDVPDVAFVRLNEYGAAAFEWVEASFTMNVLPPGYSREKLEESGITGEDVRVTDERVPLR